MRVRRDRACRLRTAYTAIFFSTLKEQLSSVLTIQEDDILFTTDHSIYVANMPVTFLSFSISRAQYDSWQYLPLGDNLAISVCFISGKPAAYIMDLNMFQFVGGDQLTHETLSAFGAASLQACPDMIACDIYNLTTASLLGSIYTDTVFASDTADCGSAIFSGHVFPRGFQATLQFFPVDAYEGATFLDAPLTAQTNHDLSGTSALTTEYLLVTNRSK